MANNTQSTVMMFLFLLTGLALAMAACSDDNGTVVVGDDAGVNAGQDTDEVCEPQCDGRECGDDGCGGSCGSCSAGEDCVGGLCVDDCTADCDGIECGDDGCGGSCGSCGGDEDCVAGTCVADCVPDCAGRDCGDDGCGGSCGECHSDDICTDDGQCVSTCTPDCSDRECGGDGCGGNCGSCGFEEECDDGQCVPDCIADCDGKDCGDDGCGGSCGECEPQDSCEENICVDACGNTCDDGEYCRWHETDPQCVPPASFFIFISEDGQGTPTEYAEEYEDIDPNIQPLTGSRFAFCTYDDFFESLLIAFSDGDEVDGMFRIQPWGEDESPMNPSPEDTSFTKLEFSGAGDVTDGSYEVGTCDVVDVSTLSFTPEGWGMGVFVIDCPITHESGSPSYHLDLLDVVCTGFEWSW